MAARSEDRSVKAIARIKSEIPYAQITFLNLDLSDLKKANKAAMTFLKLENRLDILINNAGVMAVPFEITVDGFESQFAINHLGHFAFTLPLLPLLEKSAPSRIVIVSSLAHIHAPLAGIPFEILNEEHALNNWTRYGASKLANILFARSLAEMMKDKQVWVNSVHPGTVNTGLKQGAQNAALKDRTWISYLISNVVNFVMEYVSLSPAAGALTQLYVATSEDIEEKNYRGEFFIPFGQRSWTTWQTSDSNLREKLWEYSEKALLNASIKN
ncbi:hypothetical protein HK096_001211 [Nowakowskiella sp. JEL0078]|nr:hypothetical protein HK096_001211 [Nowakowskiella sp. JEL0078]